MVGFKIDLEAAVVRARLRGGVGVGGVLTLGGEAIRDADRLRRMEGDVTDVDIRCLGLTGGDERNSACAPPAATDGNGTTFAWT